MSQLPQTHPALSARLSGVLLHPSSLPGGDGIGDIGGSAHEFVDFLQSAKQQVWQVLPMGPTSREEHHSPYASVSAFAGNPLLISLEALAREGLLGRRDLERHRRLVRRAGGDSRVDFQAVEAVKDPLLAIAARNFSGKRADADIERFVSERPWAATYAAYAALRERYRKPRERWPVQVRFCPRRLPEGRKARALEPEARKHLALQVLFARQWGALRSYARSRGVRLFGDLPIYVSSDSADVWANPELFEVDRRTGKPALVSGVPPDIFNSEGQLWNHPLYRWREMRRDRYRWWIDRFRELQRSFDIVRVDHFRGFESYWAVPGGARNAKGGSWRKAPGEELFAAVQKDLGHLPLFVEDLGIITPEVHALRERFSLMGTRVLQFAFSGDTAGTTRSRHHPINIPHHSVTYTATHDNAPVSEWYAGLPAANKAKVRGLLNDCAPSQVAGQFVRLAMSLPARICIVPLQDILGVGRGHRMNSPGTVSWDNWSWRFTKIPAGTARRMASLSGTFERNTG